jgi:catalase (peroxidase I)
MANKHYADEFYDKALRAEVHAAIVNRKLNVCPFAIRLAWHSSGTFDKDDKTAAAGGSNGATMRFEPEISDDANAGLALMQDIIRPVKSAYPDLSYADLFTVTGAVAAELTGCPVVPFNYGRTDDVDGTNCPANGRLPDASQGAEHLREVFGRMGFNDQEIVILSGAHTLGSCHKLRSGFDGPWTRNPLKFDNEYFTNLLTLEWNLRDWDGPQQFQDPTGELMMLPTDMALIQDAAFLPWVQKYAADEDAFKQDFAAAFGKLIALGCPAHVQPDAVLTEETVQPVQEHTPEKAFRDLAMHGSVEKMQAVISASTVIVDVNSKEPHSDRTALHKAAIFGHVHVIEYLISNQFGNDKIDVNALDVMGDTPLHDAAKYGHVASVEALLKAGAVKSIVNNDRKLPCDLAAANGKDAVAVMLAVPFAFRE